MKWYFAYNAYTEESQFPLIRMAVNSARRYTDLEPNCIISGPRGACSDWLESRGVRLHFRDVRIIDDLVRHKDANPNFDLNAARGAYLRLEIGDIERDDKFVLYTDTDVMFRSIDGIGSVRPWLLSMAPDVDQRDWRNPNTGVMIINVPRFRRWSDRIYDLARRNLSEMLNHDQTAIVQAVRWRWQRLPSVFNWKPYWGYFDQAKIVHWHGLKPAQIEVMLAGGIDRFPPPYQSLFRANSEAYSAYLPLAQELAGRE
jgi:hypothetical protein